MRDLLLLMIFVVDSLKETLCDCSLNYFRNLATDYISAATYSDEVAFRNFANFNLLSSDSICNLGLCDRSLNYFRNLATDYISPAIYLINSLCYSSDLYVKCCRQTLTSLFSSLYSKDLLFTHLESLMSACTLVLVFAGVFHGTRQQPSASNR